MKTFTVKRDKRDVAEAILLTILGLLASSLFAFGKRDLFTNINDFFFWVLKVAGIIALPLLIISLVRQVQEIASRKPLLIISDAGIEQSLVKYQNGLILWGDIKNIYVRPIGDNFFVSIKLNDPEKYISNKKILDNLKNLTSKHPHEGEIRFMTRPFKSKQREAIDLLRSHLQKSQRR